ncbi:NRAMP family divalent metal transporter [Paenibacillus hunanensis]|uniref:NRAMP family divalent metal transporter n=1 Tax=Paenibacillus hunanensis TaxID=539262 RepID=UPI002A6A50E5|nr:NRAMP family divalent metal transporter [Paenibacillus hunanensis]WPP39693.1 NRAMP family divalent metal transporter [Paenibacillus hunanensis]
MQNQARNLSPAVLDQAHVGDIHGAFGTVGQHDTAQRKSWLARLRTLLVIMGPGLIVMVGDNDAGGVATYAQAGQNYGTHLLWVLLLLIPVLIVNQEMVVRLGLVTGVGHAKLIFERFGRFWGAFSVGDLLFVNFLTLVTEFIGVDLAMSYFGVSPYVSVPIAAVLLIASTLTGSFRRWETVMYLFIAVNFLAIPLAVMSHPVTGTVIHNFLVPGVGSHFNSNMMLLIISMVGTTVAPWQLFFQQSNVIDKRLTPRWMAYERADTVIGSFVVIIGAAALIIATGFAFHHTHLAGAFVDGGAVARGLHTTLGSFAGASFAIILLNASLIGAAAVTLSTSYAIGDTFGIKHSLHRKVSDAPGFYISYALMVLIAGGIVLVPHAPLGVITTAVQALAGILLPSATVFLLLLCNDKEVLGPWVNKLWLNIVSSVIVGVLVMLSFILAAQTLFPAINIGAFMEAMLIVFAAGLLVSIIMLVRQHGKIDRTPASAEADHVLVDPRMWRMPPLQQLSKPVWSKTRKFGMLTLRAYLFIAVLMMIVKAIQLALGM